MGEGNHNVGVLMDEVVVEVHKTKEGLNVLNYTRFGPILDSLNLLHRHRESGGREDIAQILHSVSMELALQGIGEESVFTQSPEDFQIGRASCRERVWR